MSVKTHIIYPVYHSNERTVFHVPAMSVSTNWRLTDIRAKSVGGDLTLQFLVGMNAIIKNIHLYAGNLPLDSLREAHRWLAFKQLLRGNENNAYIDHALSGTRFGFFLDYTNAANIPEIQQIHTGHDFVEANQASDSKNAWLSLRRALGLLNATNILPKIDNLRLVIEWMPYNKALFRGTSAGVTGMTVAEPNLILDEIVGGSQSNSKIDYVSIEEDRIVVPAIDDGVINPIRQRLNGFNNKLVKRILLVNQVIANNATDTDGSSSQNEEIINVRLNGRAYLGTAIDTHNKKVAMCQDVWGSQNIAQGCQYDKLVGGVGGATFLSALVNSTRGVLSYGGLLINDRINDLEIEYQRTGNNDVRDAMGTSAFDLVVLAEVVKSFDVKAMDVKYL